MASLSVSNLEIKSNLATIMGLPRDPDNWAPTVIADVDRVIRSGRRRFFSAHQWTFLEKDITVVTEAPQTTGTIEIVAGVVELTGDTWPTDIVDNYMLVAADGIYEVGTYTDTTHVTLLDTSVDADALSTYTLYRIRYALPSNFAAFIGPVISENQNSLYEASALPDFQMRMLQNIFSVQYGRPQQFAVMQTLDESADLLSPVWKMAVWPLPDAVYVIKARVRVAPGDALAAAEDDLLINPQFSECLAEAIYSAGELLYKGNGQGPHAQRFYELLPEAIRKDGQMKGTRRILSKSSGFGREIPELLPLSVAELP